MLTINLWKSNLRGICNYYLSCLAPKEEREEKNQDQGEWLKFVMDKAKEKDFETIKEKLTPYGLEKLMIDCILAGAFMRNKKKEAFFIRETFKKKEDEEQDKKQDKKQEKKAEQSKKNKESVFS